jgi:nucleoside-diphosphate-sugar epimerase
MGEGIGMIPLSEEVMRAIESADLVRTTRSDPDFEFLSDGVAAWARRLSLGTRVIYVEAEFIAGEGSESAVMWSDGKVTLGPLHGTDSVKRALHALGVEPRDGCEAFDLVGLGRKRSPNDWLDRFH